MGNLIGNRAKVAEVIHAKSYARIACQKACLIGIKADGHNIIKFIDLIAAFGVRICVNQKEINITVFFGTFVKCHSELIALHNNILCSVICGERNIFIYRFDADITIIIGTGLIIATATIQIVFLTVIFNSVPSILVLSLIVYRTTVCDKHNIKGGICIFCTAAKC